MAIQTQTFKMRVRAHSGLPPQALLVALVIADLRYTRRLHEPEPLQLTYAQLARECGMSRATLTRHLKTAVDSGWIITRRVFQDGRQRGNQYYLNDPTPTTRAPLHPVDNHPDTEAQRRASGQRLKPDTEAQRRASVLRLNAEHKQRLDVEPPVVRSTYQQASPRPPGLAASPDEQDTRENPAPEPPVDNQVIAAASWHQLQAELARIRGSKWAQPGPSYTITAPPSLADIQAAVTSAEQQPNP